MQIFNKDQLKECCLYSAAGDQCVMLFKPALPHLKPWAYLFDQDKVRLHQTAVFAGVKDLQVNLENRPGQYMLIPEDCVDALLHQHALPMK